MGLWPQFLAFSGGRFRWPCHVLPSGHVYGGRGIFNVEDEKIGLCRHVETRNGLVWSTQQQHGSLVLKTFGRRGRNSRRKQISPFPFSATHYFRFVYFLGHRTSCWSYFTKHLYHCLGSWSWNLSWMEIRVGRSLLRSVTTDQFNFPSKNNSQPWQLGKRGTCHIF